MSTLVERLGDAMVAHVKQVLRDYGISDETIANDPEIASSTREVVDALSARLTPPAEVVRYEPMVQPFRGEDVVTMAVVNFGQWVRYKDHAAALAASEEQRMNWQSRAAERDAEAEKWFRKMGAERDRADTSEAALAASEAKRKEAEDEIAALDGLIVRALDPYVVPKDQEAVFDRSAARRMRAAIDQPKTEDAA